MKKTYKGKVVVLHLAAQYPFAGVVWQLVHHLVGLRDLGLDVYYLEDHGAWTRNRLLSATLGSTLDSKSGSNFAFAGSLILVRV